MLADLPFGRQHRIPPAIPLRSEAHETPQVSHTRMATKVSHTRMATEVSHARRMTTLRLLRAAAAPAWRAIAAAVRAGLGPSRLRVTEVSHV